jgi:hypothetical protein
MLSQVGIAIVACLSYNMLLGQGGMLSFGHAVYTGSARSSPCTRCSASATAAADPVEPDSGRRRRRRDVLRGPARLRDDEEGGTPFAMITLGLGELVTAMSLMIPSSSAARAASRRTARSASRSRHHYGPQIQVYYLLAIYTFDLHGGDVRVHADAARPDAQRRARQPRARRVHRLQHAARALPVVHHRRLLRRRRRRHVRAQLRDRDAEVVGAGARARTCSSPSSAARPSSSDRSSAAS